MIDKIDERVLIADLVKRVACKAGFERAAVCSVDCLLQWKEGLLEDTIVAWDGFLVKDDGVTSNRHGAWVPAIPLKYS
jgi:hypothetical protein